jgi:hypothetical protein
VAVCQGTKRDGTLCTANAIPGQRYCYHHHPAYKEERRSSASRAATLKYRSIGKELRDIRELIWELLGVLLSDQLPLRVKRELQNVVQLLQCYLRAAELEMRAAEEPLRSDLDVKGLKAQVLERIEVLEAQERERQELLSELVPAMEARGYETGAVKAVVGS